jgi:hypothetical protein
MSQGKIKRPIRQDGVFGEFSLPVVFDKTRIDQIPAKINRDYSHIEISSKFLTAFGRELTGVWHGSVSLKICLRDGKYVYPKILKEIDAGIEGGYDGDILPEAIKELEKAAAELIHGTITLTFYIRAGKLFRYEIDPKRSVLVGGSDMPGQHMAENYAS